MTTEENIKRLRARVAELEAQAVKQASTIDTLHALLTEVSKIRDAALDEVNRWRQLTTKLALDIRAAAAALLLDT